MSYTLSLLTPARMSSSPHRRALLRGLAAVAASGLLLAGVSSASSAAVPTTGSPIGYLDVATAVQGGVRVAGWAWDPDTTEPVAMVVTVGGVKKWSDATLARPDVAAVFPSAGGFRGFDVTVPTSSGSHQVCLVARDYGYGSDTSFGCRTVTVGTSTTVAAPAPAPAQPGTVGVPAGTVLRVHEGDLTITTPGAVIDSMDIRGFVRVKAPDVTIKNSIIRGKPGLTSYMSLIQAGDLGPRLTVVDSELVAADPSPFVDGIVGKRFTLRRVNIHGVIDQVKITGDDVLIENSRLHGNLHYLQDPNYGNTPTHDDNIQIQRGNNITIRNTTLESAHNAAVQITQDSGDVANVTFTGNKVNGGACTVNVAEKSYGPISGLKFTNNTFGLNTRIARCAILMPATTKSLSTVTGNLFTDGTVATVSRG